MITLSKIIIRANTRSKFSAAVTTMRLICSTRSFGSITTLGQSKHTLGALHEIGHVVKGDRHWLYLAEYHAEQYAIDKGMQLGLPKISLHIKLAHKYVLDNLLEDVLFRNLNPNAVRREVRAWLGVTPTKIKKLALARARKILKSISEETHTDHSPISKVEKQIVKQRKPILNELTTDDSDN